MRDNTSERNNSPLIDVIPHNTEEPSIEEATVITLSDEKLLELEDKDEADIKFNEENAI